MSANLPLREARIRRGLSQPAAAKAAGMTQAQLSLIERGKAGVSVPTLHRIAGVVGLDDLAASLAPYVGPHA